MEVEQTTWKRELASLFKITNVNFSNVGKEVQKANDTPNYLNAKWPSPRHIILKLAKVNNKEFSRKPGGKKTVTYKGNPIRLPDLSARGEWNDTVKILKDRNHQPRVMCPTKLSFRYEGEIKAFPDTQSWGNSPPQTCIIRNVESPSTWNKKAKYTKFWVRSWTHRSRKLQLYFRIGC